MQNQTTIADERAAEAAEAAAIYAPHPVPPERDEAAPCWLKS